MLAGPNSITFKVQRDIKCGEEMTVYYADHYFGIDNCECRCVSCERLQEGSFYVEKSDSEATEKDDAISPKTPPEDEHINTRRRSGRAKKEVDYIYKDILSPPRIKKATLLKAEKAELTGCSNIPLNEITNGKPLGETIELTAIDDITDGTHSTKLKQVEMDLRFICNEPQPNHWITMPADHNCGLYTQVPWQYNMLLEAQQEMLECSEEFFGQLIHLPLPPLNSQFNNRYHSGGTEGSITFDEELTQLYQWIDDQSDISDSEGSIITDMNVATCCEAAKNFRTVITSTGHELCSRCYRHNKIFGLEWPTRKNPTLPTVAESQPTQPGKSAKPVQTVNAATAATAANAAKLAKLKKSAQSAKSSNYFYKNVIVMQAQK
ncbi:hypothetical protein BD408DRAFT_118992 [Parasitella parasitica]|nr:hypothetical protein BD408DRAFT_118992 [Parasitella parasitica]